MTTIFDLPGGRLNVDVLQWHRINTNYPGVTGNERIFRISVANGPVGQVMKEPLFGATAPSCDCVCHYIRRPSIGEDFTP